MIMAWISNSQKGSRLERYAPVKIVSEVFSRQLKIAFEFETHKKCELQIMIFNIT